MLDVQGVVKTFHADTENEVRALQGLSLRVKEGSFVVVIGTNGSGKSTLQNALSGSVLVDEGQIFLAGQEITRWSEHRRAALIGRVFQNPFSGTAPNMSVGENLALAKRRGLRRTLRMNASLRSRDELADRVRCLGMGLENRLDNEIGSLSGGQRQALTLLMATLRRPMLLLLDEHTAALDPRAAEMVIGVTDSLVREGKLTTLMVTHSMQQAVNLGDRLIMMHRGRIVADISGAEKKRLRPGDLLDRFDAIKRREQIDSSVAEMLREAYV
ncbi:ATP-binding cassette domain-containing protein [Aminithiophilus ramosus]|uniref:ATP-binding cassette domain-containing protein n=1 Tax=Aminithiophilus ramosus TaxID=3029084 RepID=A0A9Q7AMZ4_9BACT|nr:ATP-binding cassette domain-containing protein [Aminithiophilus ramosus]QTX31191.1 ATP-binding cassette domain-containing protein [Aminithiophilus ramosus]